MYIPCSIIKELILKYNIKINQLGNMFIDNIFTNESIDLENWVSSLNEEEKSKLKEILKLIAAPNIFIDLSSVIENELLINNYVITNNESQAFIGITEDNRIEIKLIENMCKLINSIIVYLDMGIPLAESNYAFNVEIEDMPTLFALIDLHQRKKYSALLDHTILGEELFQDDIEFFFKDSLINRDLRWLLPFSLDQFTVKDNKINLEKSLMNLEKLKVVEKKQEAWYFTVQGRAFADLCINRISQMALTVIDADSEGNLQKIECVLVRSNRILWLFLKEPTENNVIITALSNEKAVEYFNGLFSSEGEPKVLAPVVKPVDLETAKDVKRSKAPKFCPKCGNPIKLNQKFCNMCGKKLINDKE